MLAACSDDTVPCGGSASSGGRRVPLAYDTKRDKIAYPRRIANDYLCVKMPHTNGFVAA